MDRRALLSALAAGTTGFAGCVTTDPPNGPTPGESATVTDDRPSGTARDRDTPTPTGPSDGTAPAERTATPADADTLRRVSVAERDAVDDDHAVRMNVEVRRRRVTDRRTARFAVTTTNTGPRRALSVGSGGCALFNRSEGGSDDPAGLWLYRPERAASVDRAGSEWRADRPADASRVYQAYGCLPVAYGPGESRTTEYVLWDDYRVEGYLTPGSYRWETDVGVWTDADPGAGDDPSGEFTWGFSLRVEE